LRDRILSVWPSLLVVVYGLLVLAYAAHAARYGSDPHLAVAIALTSLVIVGLLAGAMQLTMRDIGSLHAQVRAALAERGNAQPDPLAVPNAQRLAVVAGMIDDLVSENTRLSHAVRQISGNIAHELARPIVFILRYIDEIDTVCENCSPVFDAIYDKVTNIHAMYIRILDITRMSEISKFSLTEVDLADVITESVNFCAEDIGEKSLVVDIAAAPAPVLGEFWLLTSAVSNVIANAVRYSPDGARLALSTGRDGAIPFVLVEDAGPGVPDRDLPALLARLKRDSEGERQMDHGFGLRLVQATAAMHGANVTLARSRLGGLAFRMAFPNAVIASADKHAGGPSRL